VPNSVLLQSFDSPYREAHARLHITGLTRVALMATKKNKGEDEIFVMDFTDSRGLQISSRKMNLR
jgi:hypothetical protein